MTTILGISGSAADASACLLVDGEVVAAVEEERLTRQKHVGGFPAAALKWVGGRSGGGDRWLEKIDAIGFHCRPRLHLTRRLPRYLRNLRRAPADNLFSIVDEVRKYGSLVRNQIRAPFGSARVHVIEHHLNHAASAYFFEGFDDAAILTMDYIGESTSTLLAHGQGNRIVKLREIAFPHSLGALYSYVTQWLGFQPHSDEYKVMGLAPYGRPRYVDRFRKFVTLKPDGTYEIALEPFDWWFRRYSTENTHFGRVFGRRRVGKITEHHEDVAYAVQKVLEETLLHVASSLQKRTGSENLCLAGGVALNSVANGVLQRSGLFKRVTACPASHDGGLSVGAALYVHHAIMGKPPRSAGPIPHVYWGPAHDDAAIDSFLDESKLKFRRVEDPAGLAAAAIANGKVVGWFQGAEEFGPRALGGRSILADPRRAEMKDIVNRCVKFREPFRPFAPSCLAEEAHKWFEMPEALALPYMLFVHPVRPEMREKIPAITHVDGSARIHTVDRDSNPRYRALIRAFQMLTGVPMVLNTSFNVKGEPIVSSPADAVRCFFSTGLDMLFLGTRLLEK